MPARICWTDAALDWTAAALYATRHGNHDPALPTYDDLPQRLKDKWRERARVWLDAIIPLLAIKDTTPST